MRAVGFQQPGSVDREDALCDIDLPMPVPEGRDLLVEVKAVSVNPIDTKVRKSAQPDAGSWKVLGWDASGVVHGVGPQARDFRVGDKVFYAGALNRPGTNSEYHLVDERIVGKMPSSLDWASARRPAADRHHRVGSPVRPHGRKKPVTGGARALLVIGGAGGVGSIAIQLARALTDLVVIATASRPETTAWAREMGAHHVIDHSQGLAAQVAALGLGAPSFVFSTTQTQLHLAEIAELIAPQGRFALIDDAPSIDVNVFKRKSVSIHWELMFTRSLFGTADIAEQGRLLNDVARLIDAGVMHTTLTERFDPIDAANLRKAHALIESGRARGKIVLEGFKPQA